MAKISTLTPAGAQKTQRGSALSQVDRCAVTTKTALWGAGRHDMSKFDALYCAHVEQIGLRYPDAWHVRYAWAVAPTQIESKVFFGDEAVVVTSVLEPTGEIWHRSAPYTPWATKKARANGLRTN